MKRTIIFLLILTMLTGCGLQEKPTSSVQFLLPELPDIGEYEADGVKRWHDGAMPELIPSDEYGELYPYLGSVREFTEKGEEQGSHIPYYGLCTADGTLVTDAVFTEITLNDGCYLLTSEYYDENRDSYSRAYLAASDGSWVRPLYEGRGVCSYLAPDLYSVELTRYLHADGSEYEVSLDGYLISVNGVPLLENWDSTEFRTVDKDLNAVYGPFELDRDGAYGELVVRSGGNYAIVDSTGEAVYTASAPIWYDGGSYFVKSGENGVTRLNTDKTEAESLTFPGSVSEVIGGHAEAGGVYYTLQGEKTDIVHINYDRFKDTYIMWTARGSLIRDGEEEAFVEGVRAYSGAVYEDTVAVSDGREDFLYSRADSTLIRGLLLFDNDSYRVEEDERYYVYNAKGVLLCAVKDRYHYEGEDRGLHFYRRNGVLYTVRTTGEVLVKIHSDTE